MFLGFDQPEFDPERKGFDLFTIYYPDRKYEEKTDGTQSSNPHGLAGFKTCHERHVIIPCLI